MPEAEKFGVAIAGLGTVGSGVAQILSESRSGEQGLFLKSVLEREPEKGPASEWFQKIPEAFVKNQEAILEDPEIRVIVETIGGTGYAREFTLEALKRGKHVVTANKDLIASHGSELCEMAQSRDRHYLFEAAVAGAIPVLRLLREYFQTRDILELEGILNGTTNYILSEMESRSLGFEETLKKAQELGFAEQDPTNDIKGFDARYKLVILIYLISGKWISPSEIYLEGIDQLELPDFEYASRMGRSIKLIAHMQRIEEDGKRLLQAYVLPMMQSRDNMLSKISGSTNALTLKGRFSEDISITGKGAGSLPTASSIVSDLERIARDETPVSWPTVIEPIEIMPFRDTIFRHTLRFEVYDEPGIVGMIGKILAESGINIYALEQLPQYHRIGNGKRETVIFTITLEPCIEGVLQEALDKINLASFMIQPVNVLRESQ